jgi:hypothetical protein
MKTVQDVEDQLQQNQKLREVLKDLGLLHDGFTAVPRLYGEEKKKKKNAAFKGNWNPETDSIYIHFEPIQDSKTPLQEPAPRTSEVSTNSTKSDGMADLIRALDRAEARPGFNFVALKWFRDTALLSEGFAWAQVESARKSLLSEAIERRLILTNSVPNPKSPQFPVTAIRLNRLMPEVIAILGSGDSRVPDFQPVVIRGENLSTTVLRDRR